MKRHTPICWWEEAGRLNNEMEYITGVPLDRSSDRPAATPLHDTKIVLSSWNFFFFFSSIWFVKSLDSQCCLRDNADVVLQKNPTIITFQCRNTKGDLKKIRITNQKQVFAYLSVCFHRCQWKKIISKPKTTMTRTPHHQRSSHSDTHLTSPIHLHLAFCNFLSCKRETRNGKIPRIWTIAETSPTLLFLMHKPPERLLCAVCLTHTVTLYMWCITGKKHQQLHSQKPTLLLVYDWREFELNLDF